MGLRTTIYFDAQDKLHITFDILPKYAVNKYMESRLQTSPLISLKKKFSLLRNINMQSLVSVKTVIAVNNKEKEKEKKSVVQ